MLQSLLPNFQNFFYLLVFFLLLFTIHTNLQTLTYSGINTQACCLAGAKVGDTSILYPYIYKMNTNGMSKQNTENTAYPVHQSLFNGVLVTEFINHAIFLTENESKCTQVQLSKSLPIDCAIEISCVVHKNASTHDGVK